MLTVEECRKKLGKFGENESDEEIEAIRNKLYALCDLVIDQAIDKVSSGKPLH